MCRRSDNASDQLEQIQQQTIVLLNTTAINSTKTNSSTTVNNEVIAVDGMITSAATERNSLRSKFQFSVSCSPYQLGFVCGW